MYLEGLVESRREFLQQLYNLCRFQLEGQFHEALSEEEIVRTIAIDASLGMGKTYFAQALETMVMNENSSSDREKIKFMKFDAWKSDYFDDPMKSLIGELNEHNLINSEAIEKVKMLCSNGIKITMKALGKMLIKQFNLSDDDIALIKDMISGLNESELEDYKKYKGMVEGFKDTYAKDPTLKIIVIDELDRCRPDYAIKLLETIKHIFDIKNILFVFLVNKEQLKSIVSTMYLKDDGTEEYFEKFFDIQFKLPEVAYKSYLKKEYSDHSLDKIWISANGQSITLPQVYDYFYLEFFKNNQSKAELEVSIRKFKKSFKKYKVLMGSLSLEEKEALPLVLILSIYYQFMEFKNKNNQGELPKYIITSILEMFFKKATGGVKNIQVYGQDYLYEDKSPSADPYSFQIYKAIIQIMLGDNSYVIKSNKNNFGSDIYVKHITIKSRHIIYSKEEYSEIQRKYMMLSFLELPLSGNLVEKNRESSKNILLEWCRQKYYFIKSIEE